MPRLLREIAETVLDIPLDLGNWLQGFLPWDVPDGLYTTIAPNFFAIVHDLASRYPKAEEVALVGKLIFAFEELARTGKPRPGLAPDEEADLRFCYRTIIAGFTAKLHSAYWNLARWICQSPFRFRSVLRIVRRHRHFRLNPPSPSAEDWKRTTEILNGKLELLNQTIRHEHERTRRKIEETNGLVQKVLPAITKALPFLRDRHRYKVPVKVAAAAMGISTRELYRILNHKVEAPDGFPGLDDEVRFYHWVANYRKRIGLQSAIQEKAEDIRKWGRQVSVR